MNSGPEENQWSLIEHCEIMATQPTAQSQAEPNGASVVLSPAATIEVKAESSSDAKNTDEKTPVEPKKPSLKHHDTFEPYYSEAEFYTEPEFNSRSRPRRRSMSPYRQIYPRRITTEVPMLTSSSLLLSRAGNHDGIADLPYPARSTVYLTTFPFSDRDVQKWAWLFNLGVEEKYVYERDGYGRPDPYLMHDEWVPDTRDVHYEPIIERRRARSPYYDPLSTGISTVFFSKALDTDIIPEETDNLQYVIVVQGQSRGDKAAKLLVAQSRKAAGMLMYVEVLSGCSIVFVGAMKKMEGKNMGRKFKKVEKLEELSGDGKFFGVIC